MATVNAEQIKKFSEFLKQLPDSDHGLSFTGDMYPKLNHQEAINFFFFVCLHQYGFWHGNESGYEKPLVGVIGGKESKGSELLWKVAMRAFDKSGSAFTPDRLAYIDAEELFLDIFVDDNGPILFPDPQERFRITKNYGRWFVGKGISPSDIMGVANGSNEPLKYFLWQVRQIAGYNEDPFEKKNLLLAMTLANRPEKFLRVKDPQNWLPIIDYHLMRLSLRLGLVDLDQSEQGSNKARGWVDGDSEYNIRSAVYSAVTQVIAESGRSMSFIDQKMWMARRYCPEMTKPDCPKCVFMDICKKRTELFQPIFRTTAY